MNVNVDIDTFQKGTLGFIALPVLQQPVIPVESKSYKKKCCKKYKKGSACKRCPRRARSPFEA